MQWSEFALRVTGGLAGAVCVGSLVFAVFFESHTCGELPERARRYLRGAALCAPVWGAAGLLLAWQGGGDRGELTAAILTALLTVVLALVGGTARGWRTACALVFVALLGLVVPAVERRSDGGPGHDIGTNTIVMHVLAATVWFGVLLVLGSRLWRDEERAQTLLARYRTLAGCCWALLVFSGVFDVLAVPRRYGEGEAGHLALVLGKTFVTVALGGLGVLARRHLVPAEPTGRGGRRRALLWLVGVEAVLLTSALLVSTVMIGTASGPAASEVTASESVLGYDLAVPPSAVALVTGWRFDPLFGGAAVVLSGLYLAGVRVLRRRGDAWPTGRTAAWITGWGCVLWVTSSGMGVYAGGVFSLHMFVHMVLNMVAPVLLVLGGPVTLALRALPARGRGAAAGPREWLLAVLHSPLTRVLAGPGVATVLFVGSFYALYFTDLFELGMFEYWGHQLMKTHFLLVGYLYYWTVIGVDPGPRPLPHLARLGVVLAVMPFHAFFGIITMSLSSPLAEDFYRALELPWPRDLLADQFLGGGIAWAMGEVPLVLVLGALLTQWYRHDTRLARRVDRSDDELAAYNAMLAELARKRGG
ncbi:cytochrome c oxidase assembly protein [Actinopolyspora mortivallis]|uniref:cytochrome c oxidase assembly protein n=1 Tax=Actinopolyspora mortivallis TaxID=33906 RepID=UPI0003690DF8